MRMNMEALKALEIKLAEYSKANGVIAEHEAEVSNLTCAGCGGTPCISTCKGGCNLECLGSCKNTCSGGPKR